jgi:inorganic pyrophosphatase/exopolyphosphatase
LRPGVTQEQKKAMDFFNRYTKEQEAASQNHNDFKQQTSDLFKSDFKGFDFKVGEKKFRYGVQNPEKLADKQSNITNLVGKFFDKEGKIQDKKGYHKAIYAAENVDTIASHFYEQGKADAIREVVDGSKNPSADSRPVAQTDGFKNGIKAKVISDNFNDSSKLTIKKIKI